MIKISSLIFDEGGFFLCGSQLISWGLSGRRPNSRCDEKNFPVFSTSGKPVPPCSGMGGHGRQ
ncbi:hypothetical protein, partial [Akkermansia sp. UBA3271]|uniref:hypothetical protein n=1 Tax=Akkermansia sp. UBA3271 TaxID=1945963 RepID=UPI0025B7B0E5